MSTETETVPTGSEVQAESNLGSGEPQGSTENNGESVKGEANREPSGEGLFDGMKPEDLHKSYKSLQSEYTKAQTAIKKLEKYGGPDQLTQWADYLSNNQEFAKWAQSQHDKNVLGTQEEVDPDQQKALDAVRKIAESIVDQRVKDLYQKDVAPLSEAYKQQMLQGHFEKMDSKYGKDWHEMRDTMSELSENLPKSVQDRPGMEDIEDLFFKALRKTGKMDTYVKHQYEKELTAKKAKSTERPSTTPQAGSKSATSIQEAFEMAKRAHNVT
jgi:hypothetical protein